MKYSFKRYRHPSLNLRGTRRFRHAGAKTLRRFRQRALTEIPLIDISALLRAVDTPLLTPPRAEPRRRVRIVFGKRISKLFAAVASAFFALFAKISAAIDNRRQRAKEKSSAMLLGMLLAAVTVTALSGVLVILPYLFRYTRSYTRVTVPDFTELTYTEVISTEDHRFDLIINLTENINAKGGEIISQTPKAGVSRRLYGKRDRVTVTLTVCRPEETVTMENFVGMSARDAELALRNAGFSVKIAEKYSDDTPKGTVISTFPAKDEVLEPHGEVSLTVSRGRRIIYVTVPSLAGISESEAVSRIKSRGLSVGEIKYRPAESSAGTVIAQDLAPGTSAELGSKVSLTVSNGGGHPERHVPSLTGLTLAQAKAALREAGLVLGEVHYLGKISDSATVVKQTPEGESPISPSVVAVDIYMG